MRKRQLEFMLETFSPVEWFLKSIRYWWVITGLIIAGGLCGLAVRTVQNDVFESVAVISVGIDYSRAGLLTDIEEDQIVEIVGDVIRSDEVLSRASAKVSGEGFAEVLKFEANAFAERKNFRWILRVRSKENEAASHMVNIWVEEAIHELEEAYSHALVADSYSGYLESLVSCLEQSVALDTGQVFCEAANLAFVQDEIKKVNRELAEEKLASKGIFPGVLFSVTSYGETPARAIRADQNLYVLGGSMIGFLASFFVVFSICRKDD